MNKETVCKKEGKVFNSWAKNKKKVVCVDGKLIHFGDSRYRHNYSKEANEKFRNRHNCDPVNKLRKDTARFWSCEYLWDEDKWD